MNTFSLLKQANDDEGLSARQSAVLSLGGLASSKAFDMAMKGYDKPIDSLYKIQHNFTDSLDHLNPRHNRVAKHMPIDSRVREYNDAIFKAEDALSSHNGGMFRKFLGENFKRYAKPEIETMGDVMTPFIFNRRKHGGRLLASMLDKAKTKSHTARALNKELDMLYKLQRHMGTGKTIGLGVGAGAFAAALIKKLRGHNEE